MRRVIRTLILILGCIGMFGERTLVAEVQAINNATSSERTQEVVGDVEDTFEKYYLKNKEERCGEYSLNYLLENYNIFLSGNYQGTQVDGAVVCGGNFTGRIGKKGVIHLTPTYLAYPSKSMDILTNNRDLYCYIANDSDNQHVSIWTNNAKRVNQFVDFDKAHQKLQAQMQKIKLDSLMVRVKENTISKTDSYKFTKNNLIIQSNKYFEISEISQIQKLIIKINSRHYETLIYSEDEEIVIPTIQFKNATSEKRSLGIVFIFPNAKKVTIPQYIQGMYFVAPNANVTINGGNYAGCVIAESINTKATGQFLPYQGSLINQNNQNNQKNHTSLTIERTGITQQETTYQVTAKHDDSSKLKNLMYREGNESVEQPLKLDEQGRGIVKMKEHNQLVISGIDPTTNLSVTPISLEGWLVDSNLETGLTFEQMMSEDATICYQYQEVVDLLVTKQISGNLGNRQLSCRYEIQLAYNPTDTISYQLDNATSQPLSFTKRGEQYQAQLNLPAGVQQVRLKQLKKHQPIVIRQHPIPDYQFDGSTVIGSEQFNKSINADSVSLQFVSDRGLEAVFVNHRQMDQPPMGVSFKAKPYYVMVVMALGIVCYKLGFLNLVISFLIKNK